MHTASRPSYIIPVTHGAIPLRGEQLRAEVKRRKRPECLSKAKTKEGNERVFAARLAGWLAGWLEEGTGWCLNLSPWPTSSGDVAARRRVHPRRRPSPRPPSPFPSACPAEWLLISPDTAVRIPVSGRLLWSGFRASSCTTNCDVRHFKGVA